MMVAAAMNSFADTAVFSSWKNEPTYRFCVMTRRR